VILAGFDSYAWLKLEMIQIEGKMTQIYRLVSVLNGRCYAKLKVEMTQI